MTGLMLMAAALTVAAQPGDQEQQPARARESAAPSLSGCRPVADGPGTGASDGPAAPASRPTSSLAGLGFELEVNNDKPEAGVSWGHKSRPCLRTDGDTSTFGQTGFTASVSVPIGGNDDLADPQTLDKLSNGAKVTFGVSRFGFSGSDAGSGYKPGTGWQVGATASIGYNRFRYREPTTLNERSTGKVQFSAGAFGALIPTDGRSLVGFGVEYQYAYKALDDTIQCKPVVVSPATDCANSAPGRPNKDDGLLFSLEYRRTIGIGWNFADLAVSPKATVDALDGSVGVELPIYLLPSRKSPILPGVKIGYASDKDKWTVGVFLKASFGLNP